MKQNLACTWPHFECISGPLRGRILRYLFEDVWFSLKSILTRNLNHSNRIRNEQVMAKLRKLVETEKQGTTCTGTPLTCTGTYMCSNFAHNVGFYALFPYFSTQFNSILILHLKTIPNSSWNLFSIQFIFQLHIFLQNSFINSSKDHSNMN